MENEGRASARVPDLDRPLARLLLLHFGADEEKADWLLDEAARVDGRVLMNGHFWIAAGKGGFTVKYRREPYPDCTPKLRPEQREINAFYRWKRSHRDKRPYSSRLAAWRRVLRFWIKDRRPDLNLRPYSCTFGKGPHKKAELHYHIGHSNQNILWGKYPPGKRLAHLVRKYTVYPYYRVRSRYRKWINA